MTRRSPRRRLGPGALRVGLGVVALIALLAWLGWRVAVPAWIEGRIAAELAALGLPEASFDVRSFGADGLVLSDVELGRDLRIDEVHVSFHASRLRAGRVDGVIIRGARWEASLDAETLRSSSIARLLAVDGAGETVPFARLDLVDSEVALALDDGPWVLPVAASVRSAEDERLTVRGRLGDEGDGLALSVAGHGSPADLRLSFELDGAVPSAVLAELAPGLRDAAATLSARGRARLAPDDPGRSRVSLDALGATLHATELGLAGGQARFDDLRATLRGRGVLDADGLVVDLAEASQVAASRVRFGDGSVAERVELAPALRIAADGTEVRVAAPRPLSLTAEGLAFGRASPVRIEPLSVEIAAREDSPLLHVLGGRARIAARLDGRAERSRGVAVGRRARLVGDVDAEIGPGGATVDAPLELTVDRLALSNGQVVLTRPQVSLPVRWRAGEDPEWAGTLRARSIAWRGAPICAAAGRLRLEASRVAVDASCRPTERDPTRVRAALRWSEGRGGRLHLALPRSHVGRSHAAHRVVHELLGLRVTGVAEGDLHIDLDSWRRSRARLVVANATVVDPEGRRRVRGVEASLRLRRFDPLLTDGPARIAWRGATVGDLSLGAGGARARVERDAASVEELYGSVGSTRLRAKPFRVDLERPSPEIDVMVRGLSVEWLVATLSEGDVEASGYLDGHVGFQIQTEPRLRLVLGRSDLWARAPGLIRVQGAASWAAKAARAKVSDELVQERILGALSNFRYSTLGVASRQKRGTTELRLRVRGRGRDVPQELDVAVGFRGVQRLLDEAIRLWPLPDVKLRTHLEK